MGGTGVLLANNNNSHFQMFRWLRWAEGNGRLHPCADPASLPVTCSMQMSTYMQASSVGSSHRGGGCWIMLFSVALPLKIQQHSKESNGKGDIFYLPLPVDSEEPGEERQKGTPRKLR